MSDPYWKSPEERGTKLREGSNQSLLSTCERYRYWLRHRWDELFEERPVVWIGLNPSTADDKQLDPTLRRIKSFTQRMGCTSFIMLNLFALRSTDPRGLRQVGDPIGPLTDRFIRDLCANAERIVACWGTHGSYLERDRAVMEILDGRLVECLGINHDGSPAHPLYVPGDRKPREYDFNAKCAEDGR